MKRFIPYLGDTRAARAWDKLVSRDVLGAILVGATLGKAIEKALNVVLSGTVALLVGYTLVTLAFVLLFVYWHRVDAAASDAKDKAKETVEDKTG